MIDTMREQVTFGLSPAEQRAINVHKYYLSERVGYDIGWDMAVYDWNATYGPSWRRDRLRCELTIQKREIEKHKWVSSQMAGCDLGHQAIRDWIIRYAHLWRRWCDQQDELEIPN